ncbi:hypothetical protein IMZ08_07350 [Bacillus luteolus]|uniref:Uncharacterized protein n=1 Tax=Litchfieldia luteola TaxID=682179 RepID=A0ABR9QH95_9BACI|nr:hypothetical protein [Cytobacillus luteolus]MBE4907868.1 hypothetical protein [Cytobacillus luteolus]MBP1943974.1 hypothetical protein [Cytobacillus luteolus]
MSASTSYNPEYKILVSLLAEMVTNYVLMKELQNTDKDELEGEKKNE